jgi:hypothetical protein
MLNINKLILALLFVAGVNVQINAQIQIQTKPFTGLHLSSSNGLEAIVISSIDKPVEVFAEVIINRNNANRVVEYKTSSFTINPGLNLISSNSYTVLNKKYNNIDIANYENTNGYLPTGDYSLCFVLKCGNSICENSKFSELSIEQRGSCFDIQTITPTPLLLANPLDESKIKELRPNFNWIPPFPIGTDPNLTYTFTLVELQKNQSGESAIRRNRALYQSKGIQGITLAFPNELQDLKRGSKYAWQVEAVLGKTPIQQSEVWEFEIEIEELEVFPMPYVRLKTTDEQIFNALNNLKFIYREEGKAKPLKYTLYTIEGQQLNLPLPVLNTQFGETKFDIDLTTLGLENKKYYMIMVEGPNQTMYQLKFRYFYKKDVK